MAKIIRLNALILIAFPLWAYFSSENPSATALIPAIIGGLLLILATKESKLTKKLILALLIVAAIGLVKPLIGSFERDYFAPIRVIVMLFFTLASIFWMYKAVKEPSN